MTRNTCAKVESALILMEVMVCVGKGSNRELMGAVAIEGLWVHGLGEDMRCPQQ